MVGETVLLRRGDVVVTPTRFMVGSKTYAVRNIVSIRGLEVRPGCIARLFGRKTVYRVVLTTAAGEVEAYEHRDRQFVGDLLSALDRAIAMK